jgi:hypothetical protein
MSEYKTSSGVDLSDVFLKGTNTTNSGYKLKGGADLSTYFLMNNGMFNATNVGYTTINELQLGLLLIVSTLLI